MLVYEQARLDAQQTLDRYWLGEIPVDVEGLASVMGLTVIYEPMHTDLSGLIIKRASEAGAKILINSEHPEPRQRFTLAHELGHYIERTRHANDSDFSFRDSRSTDSYDLREFFADEFAGALLMPEHELGTGFARRIRPKVLADKFNVSSSAAEKRITRLRRQPS